MVADPVAAQSTDQESDSLQLVREDRDRSVDGLGLVRRRLGPRETCEELDHLVAAPLEALEDRVPLRVVHR
jgi:hypothetical protein